MERTEELMVQYSGMGTIDKLPVKLQKNVYAIALCSKRVCDATPMELLACVIACIENANLDLGLSNVDEGDNERTIHRLAEIAARDFKYTTLDELKLATYNTIKGLYDSDRIYKPTVNNIERGWHHFTQDIARKLAKTDIAKAEVEVELTEEQRKKLTRDTILNAFARFKAEGTYVDHANIVYTDLDRMGLIVFNAERKKGFLEQSIREAKATTNPLKGRTSAERDAFRKALKKLEAKDQDGTISSDAAVIAGAKRIALNVFFRELVEMGEEIADRITEYNNCN